MNGAARTQREWLLEDIEQIKRYFPGAELLETLKTPFDIKTHSFIEMGTSSHRPVVRRTKSKLPMRSMGTSEKRVGECGLSASEVMLTPEEVKIASGYLQGDLPSKLCLLARSREATERGQAPFESTRVIMRGAFL